ncbi:asparagine synthase-related protein [Agrococcus sp. ProA11]|uniref:asparagine synthase-related protein n=1 Tax=Agrococcus chionoecetis TaxID=3153752 RepID=UPI003260DE4D
MAQHLRAAGIELRPNPSQLVALRLPTTFVEQLSTPDTVFADIRLVPLGRKLVLTARGPREVTVAPLNEALDYRFALKRFLDTWTVRLRTLLRDDQVRLTADLSGGIDSRAVFALTASAAAATPLDTVVQLVSGQSVAQRADFAVAEQIAARYGATVNRPLAPLDVVPYSAKESYEGWRDLCLGLYLPIYLPKVRLASWSVNLSGLGGEGHRPFYPQKDADDFVHGFSSDGPPEMIAGWREDISRLLKRWEREDDSIHPLVRHYREFRGRFHGGLFAQTKVNVTPLSSWLMDSAVRHAGSGRRVMFDVMESSLPGVMDLQYDMPGKAPSNDDRSRVTRVPVDAADEFGAVYASTAPQPTPESGGPSAFEILARDFETCLTPDVRDLLGVKIAQEASDVVQSAVNSHSFGHARRASNVARVMSAAMVLSPAALPDTDRAG